MTPFGETVRKLRSTKGVSQKQMAQAIGVSPAYLSALEHGKRGAPSFDFIQRVAGYFNIIWDEAEELLFIAGLSHPKVVIDTSAFSGHNRRAQRHIGKSQLKSSFLNVFRFFLVGFGLQNLETASLPYSLHVESAVIRSAPKPAVLINWKDLTA